MVRDILTRGKPVIILMHVPLQTDSLLSKVIDVWGDGGLVLGEKGIVPNEASREFIDLIYADDSPVVAVLDGHVHMKYISNLKNGIKQITMSPAATGEAMLLKVQGI